MDTTWYLIIFTILVLLAYLWYSGDSESKPVVAPGESLALPPMPPANQPPQGPVYQEVGDYSEEGEAQQDQ